MKNIAIIGGNGFIGKNFVNFFEKKEFRISVLDRGAKPYNAHIDFFSTDIHHTKELIENLRNATHIIWLVHASVPSTKDDSLVDDFLLNISPLIKFLEKSNELPNLEKFIYLSSGGTVYGNYEERTPIKENFPQKPISNYGLSKSTAEKYIEYLTAEKNFESYILRPSNVFGPYQNLVKPQGIIGFAFKAIKNNLPLDLYDNGRVIRDFVYVEDLAEAVYQLILKENLERGTTKCYNVGSGEGHSIKYILDKIENISGKKIAYILKSSRNFDCEYNVLDTSKLSSEVNWKYKTQLTDGLLNVWNWINSEKNI